MAKKMTKSAWITCFGAVAALVGLVFYLITSLTGFLAGTVLNPLPIILTAAGVLLALVLVLAAEKLSPLVTDLFVVGAAVCLIAGFILFALGRVPLVADVYFIPVNYPQSEVQALNLSIVGMVCYLLSIAAMIVVAFTGRFTRE